MPAANPYAGWTLTEEQSQPAPKAELVEQPNSAANITPDMDVHDPVTYGSLTADHTLRQLHDQGIPVNFEQYIAIQNKAMQDAQAYQAHNRENAKRIVAEEAEKQEALKPGGSAYQQKILDVQSSQIQKQLEQGPSATAEAAREGALPSAQNPMGLGTVEKPKPEVLKDWAAYTEGFHNLQNLHTLFNNMATNTAGAGGVVQSLAGLATKLTDLTSTDARTYHSFVESSLIPLAKSIMGDAAATAGKETVQSAMTEALPNNADTIQSGGQKMYWFYQRALDKMQTERDLARKNGIDTSSIDTTLNDFHSFFNSPEVQKFAPAHSQPLVEAGNSPEGRAAMSQVQATANSGPGGTNAQQPTGYVSGSGTASGGPTAQTGPTYPMITNDAGGALPGLAIDRLKGLLPRQGGSQDPSLVMPPGSQGQVTWGQ